MYSIHDTIQFVTFITNQQSGVRLTATPNNVEVSMTPNLVDILATECREILDILLDMVMFPSSKYFDTKN
jgi:hypothetical protein